MKADVIIVGAGPVGCVLAERFSNILNLKVLIIEKRNHIAGNCYDEYNKKGLLYHKYGPHYLRFKSDGIMISGKTLNIDNPKLNCRLEGFNQFSPKRIILDRNLEINLKSYIAKSIKNENTIIFHNSNDQSKIKLLKKRGAILIKRSTDKYKNFDLKKIMNKVFIFICQVIFFYCLESIFNRVKI